jgi:hypothetical protein
MNNQPIFLEQCYITRRTAQLVVSVQDSPTGPPLCAVALPFLVSADETAVMAVKRADGLFSFPTLQVLATEMPWRTAMAALAQTPCEADGLQISRGDLLQSGQDVTYLTADEVHEFQGMVVAHVEERCVDIVYPMRVYLESLEALDFESRLLLMPWRNADHTLRDFQRLLSARDARNLSFAGSLLPQSWARQVPA